MRANDCCLTLSSCKNRFHSVVATRPFYDLISWLTADQLVGTQLISLRHPASIAAQSCSCRDQSSRLLILLPPFFVQFCWCVMFNWGRIGWLGRPQSVCWNCLFQCLKVYCLLLPFTVVVVPFNFSVVFYCLNFVKCQVPCRDPIRWFELILIFTGCHSKCCIFGGFKKFWRNNLCTS
jgi:hypothetical protein